MHICILYSISVIFFNLILMKYLLIKNIGHIHRTLLTFHVVYFILLHVCQYYHYLNFLVIIFYKFVFWKTIRQSNFSTSSIRVEDLPRVIHAWEKFYQKIYNCLRSLGFKWDSCDPLIFSWNFSKCTIYIKVCCKLWNIIIDYRVMASSKFQLVPLMVKLTLVFGKVL